MCVHKGGLHVDSALAHARPCAPLGAQVVRPGCVQSTCVPGCDGATGAPGRGPRVLVQARVCTWLLEKKCLKMELSAPS